MASYQAVILAAGRGTRMGDLGQNYPKALLPVGDAPVVGHQLRILHDLGVRSVFIVVGHCAASVVQYFGDGRDFGVELTYVEQPQTLGSAHALQLLRSDLTGPFLLVLGDCFFLADDFGRLVERLDEGASAIVAKTERDPNSIASTCELLTDQTGRVLGLLEKPIAPKGDLKGCGFYSLQPSVFDSVAKTPRTALRDEYELTVSLDLHVKSGHAMYAEQLQVWECNFTRPKDVLESNLEWLQRRRETYFIGRGATIEDNSTLRRVVVGPGARVSSGATLDEVVVFPNALVPAGETLRRALVTPYGTYAADARTGAGPI